jgi:hypothetical protein
LHLVSCTDYFGLQGILYLSTPTTQSSKHDLQTALLSALGVLVPEGERPQILAQLYYEQACPSGNLFIDGPLVTLPPPRVDLAFKDSTLAPIRTAWEEITKAWGEDEPGKYMVFEDREDADVQDDGYE